MAETEIVFLCFQVVHCAISCVSGFPETFCTCRDYMREGADLQKGLGSVKVRWQGLQERLQKIGGGSDNLSEQYGEAAQALYLRLRQESLEFERVLSQMDASSSQKKQQPVRFFIRRVWYALRAHWMDRQLDRSEKRLDRLEGVCVLEGIILVFFTWLVLAFLRDGWMAKRECGFQVQTWLGLFKELDIRWVNKP
ncbi:hypothetical protein BJY04DRAFT_181614 [Aspergillus karnatakaensis]|uniref:uncharacterized protein n=1 Tax=Aspergillus karnatakaensis TaxID=1810916 RepID=UPI003CCD630B